LLTELFVAVFYDSAVSFQDVCSCLKSDVSSCHTFDGVR